MKLNRAQVQSLFKLYQRLESPAYSFLQFRRTVLPGYGCAMVQWCGMWIGIEKDGYAHS